MKTYFIYSLLGLFVMSLSSMLTACSDDDNPQVEIIVSKEALTFKKTELTKKLAIKSNYAWTIASSETWCTPELSSGEPGTTQFLVQVTENNIGEVREAVLTITSGTTTPRTVTVTQAFTDVLLVTTDSYAVSAEGETIAVQMQVSGTPTFTTDDTSWIALPATRTVSTQNYSFTIDANRNHLGRTGTVTVALGDVEETITIAQSGSSLTVDAVSTGVESDAKTLLKKINLGWNLGNSLEAINSGMPSETAWGNPKTSKAMIDAVKAAGFNAVRIPCAWSGYIVDEATYRVGDAWFARVKEVVDYCMTNEMYAIINIHWDGGWLEENPTYSQQEEVNKKQKALWEQIAVYFRDYDEHLLFAGTNEVHNPDYSNPTAENIVVQQSYNQTFVDAVRSTGGRNSYRNLIVQAFNTNIDLAVSEMTLPTDAVTNRLMVEVHYYDPYDFCLNENSTKFLWGEEFSGSDNVDSWGQEDYVDAQFAKMKTAFVDQACPVILGEFGAIRRTALSGTNLTNHNKSRANFLEYVTKTAKNNGVAPFYWDSGSTDNNGFGIFDRYNCTVVDHQAADALVSGANAGRYPF